MSYLPKASFFKKSTFPDFSISNACLDSVTRIMPQSMSPTTSVLVMGPPFDNASRMASLKRRWYSSSLAAVSSGMQIEKGTCFKNQNRQTHWANVVCKVVNRKRISLKQLVYLVWVCWKAMITEKTIKEEWTNKNYSNNNYRLHCNPVWFCWKAMI